MNTKELEESQKLESESDGRVVNLNFYRIKKNLKNEGFDLITNKNGSLTLVLRLNR